MYALSTLGVNKLNNKHTTYFYVLISMQLRKLLLLILVLMNYANVVK
jgi:hypothetical protein